MYSLNIFVTFLFIYFFLLAPSSAPENISFKILSSSSIELSWQPPLESHINGILRLYRVAVRSVADSAVAYDNVVGHNTLTVQISELHPYYQYTCSVSAVTTEEGPPANASVMMPPDGKLCEILLRIDY